MNENVSPLPPRNTTLAELTPQSMLARLEKAEHKLQQCTGEIEAPALPRSLEKIHDDLDKRSICKALSFDEEGLHHKTLVEECQQGNGWKLQLPFQLERKDVPGGKTALKAAWHIGGGRVRVKLYPDNGDEEGAGFDDDEGA